MDDNDNMRGKVVRYAHGQRNHIMTPHEHGPFVRYDDLAAIVAERDALRAERDRMFLSARDWATRSGEQEARAERLADALRSIRDVAREPYGTLNAAWVASTADAAMAAEGRDG